MSHVTAADGTRLAFDVRGRPGAPPVLMLQGLGADRTAGLMQRVWLSPRFRTIGLDNRGVGRSDKPQGRYHLDDMADDAIRVLDECGFESAHVVGHSMGGVIAQLLALRHPERVDSLVLSATACHHHMWRRELLAEWASIALERGMREVSRRSMRWLVGPRSLRRYWPALGIVGPLALNVPAHAFAAQARAILDADDRLRDRLVEVRVPTLVVSGSQDILTPTADGEELAHHIPHADLVIISGAAHGFPVEHALTFNRLISDFFGRVAAPASDGIGRSDVK
ncbi:MAG TPA: alpha/beta hydrolase [Acidimicrobiales bacterium]|nr:alpha/beta hydrolase [Acidimicrobiales bacterium]